MKKHRESEILNAVLIVLRTWENSGKIAHFDRLNSGVVYIPPHGGRPARKIKLCRDGTPDIYIILKSGTTLWLECKSNIGKLTDDQAKFKAKMEKVPGQTYIVVKKIDDLLLWRREKIKEVE